MRRYVGAACSTYFSRYDTLCARELVFEPVRTCVVRVSLDTCCVAECGARRGGVLPPGAEVRRQARAARAGTRPPAAAAAQASRTGTLADYSLTQLCSLALFQEKFGSCLVLILNLVSVNDFCLQDLLELERMCGEAGEG